MKKHKKTQKNHKKTQKKMKKYKSQKIIKKSRTYKKKDFLSGDGMLTGVWGPPLWHYLHLVSL